jgi:multiple sugar transport system permease protein
VPALPNAVAVAPSSAFAAGRLRRFVLRSRRNSPQGLVPYLFIAPNLLLFATFMLFPLGYAGFISLHDWDMIGDSSYTGLANYARLVVDPLFWTSLRQTLLYAFGAVPGSIALGLLAAVGLNRRLPGRVLMRSIYFMPVVVSGVATAVIASWLFNDSYGVINALLERAGLARIHWLSSPRWALPSLIMATLWLRIGFCMIVYLAALQSIPRTYYEAALIDGASAWRQFRHITWPLLRPATFLLLVINVIYSFHVFDLVYVMTGGGPGFSTTVLVQYIFNSAFSSSEMGYACAMGIVLYALILVFTVVQWRVGRKSETDM